MKIITTLILLAFFAITSAQKYEVTPEGMFDSSDKTKTYLVVPIEGKTANQLFDGVMKYINENYKNPDAVIKGKTAGEFISFETYAPDFAIVKNGPAKVPFSAKYRTEISFKEGKVKYEITSLDMINASNVHLYWIRSGMTFGIFNKKGELKQPEAKEEIEMYFNSQLARITEFMKGKSATSQDW